MRAIPIIAAILLLGCASSLEPGDDTETGDAGDRPAEPCGEDLECADAEVCVPYPLFKMGTCTSEYCCASPCDFDAAPDCPGSSEVCTENGAADFCREG